MGYGTSRIPRSLFTNCRRCGYQTETVSHIIFHCTGLRSFRDTHLSALPRHTRLSTLLNDNKSIEAIRAFLLESKAMDSKAFHLAIETRRSLTPDNITTEEATNYEG